MDSTLLDAIFRVLAPDKSPNEAFVDNRTPSTSTAVPNEAFPCETPPSRIENTLSFIRFGFTVLPPGSRLDTSETLTICKWSSAALSITHEVLMLLRFSRAVTTTSESFRSAQHNRKTRSSLSPVTFNSLSRATYPRHETLTGCLPACTFLIEKCPLSSVIAHRFASTTVTTAIGTPFDDLPICTLPDIVYFCAETPRTLTLSNKASRNFLIQQP